MKEEKKHSETQKGRAIWDGNCVECGGMQMGWDDSGGGEGFLGCGCGGEGSEAE